MRGAAQDRAAYYVAALGTTQARGWMVPNEVRALEEMDPIEGGDEFPPLITTNTPKGDANGTD
jgi:phage portal protein BeeE